MRIDLDQAFGMHETTLALRARRAQVLARNLANADTPGFKARDYDFGALLGEAARRNRPVGLSATRVGHLDAEVDPLARGLLYRVPFQPSVDGNTVENHVEYAAFLDNAIRYQATLSFIDGRIRSIRTALGSG